MRNKKHGSTTTYVKDLNSYLVLQNQEYHQHQSTKIHRCLPKTQLKITKTFILKKSYLDFYGSTKKKLFWLSLTQILAENTKKYFKNWELPQKGRKWPSNNKLKKKKSFLQSVTQILAWNFKIANFHKRSV